METKIYNHLRGQGLSVADASLLAFQVIEALREGSIAPETAKEAYGLDDEDLRRCGYGKEK